ncbi:hypothetical protein [Streptomyces sp. SD31]|uniref:hypothetical protein n=1 Tax=Streptomyces sp. SD31 TaxID=3452208 RepID=UPI003F8C9F2F
MDWTPLAGTALGTLVGVGSTLLADRARWRRDLSDRTRQERKQIYVTGIWSGRPDGLTWLRDGRLGRVAGWPA